MDILSNTLKACNGKRTPITPFSRRNPFLPTATGYAAQALTVAAKCRDGQRVVGLKLGMTSAVKRAALGIAEPVYGRLTSGMLLPTGAALPVAELIGPRAEPELAFRLGADVPAGSTADAVLAAIAEVLPAIEVVDTRYATSFRLVDSVADNAGAARVVLGATGRALDRLPELPVLGCLFSFPGGADTAAGGAAMGDPAVAVAWLADALAARGERLEAGTLVLSGGLTAAVPLHRGDHVSAEFDGLGRVEVRCA